MYLRKLMLPSCGNSKWPHRFAPAGLEAVELIVLKETKFRFFKHSLKFINFVLNQAFFFLRIKEKKNTPNSNSIIHKRYSKMSSFFHAALAESVDIFCQQPV